MIKHFCDDYGTEINRENQFDEKVTSLYQLVEDQQKEVEQLKSALTSLLNDCINFNGTWLTDSILAEASKALQQE